MTPIISIVGRSDSGKTTLLEKLIAELRRRGYRVAVVKHDTHGFEIDRKGKDSWRLKNAGAHAVIISSSEKIALISDADHDHRLAELRDLYLRDFDIILSEGYKTDKEPKIEVFRKDVHPEPLCTEKDELVAVVSDDDVELNAPRFGLDDVKKLTDFIESRFLKKRGSSNGWEHPTAALWVNGKAITLTPFVNNMLAYSVAGLVKALKGCENPKKIQIKVELQ